MASRRTGNGFFPGVVLLLDGKNFATVATLGPGGAPQSSVVWIKRDGDSP
ncbi:pyridoxamine 5'-phosphate oxidase family protein [Streptomyces sp. NPDC052236]